MTDDHFPPEDTSLSGDFDDYPEYRGHCDRHVHGPGGHDLDCPDLPEDHRRRLEDD